PHRNWQLSVGESFKLTDCPKEAESWFRRATEDHPDHTAPWVFLGTLMSRQERLHEALEVFHKGLSALPDRDEVWLNIGNVNRALGNYDAAKAAYEAAVRLTPDYQIALERL